MKIAVVFVLSVLGAMPAGAADNWAENGWELKPTLPSTVVEVMEQHLPAPIPEIEVDPLSFFDPSYSGMGNRASDVELWRPLVETHFAPGDVPMALRIMSCESGGNPYAKNRVSTASGLFQHLRGWWGGAWGPAFDPFDPAQSVEAGARLRYQRGSWADWNASKHCWG